MTLPRELLPGGLVPSGVASFGRVTHAPADPRALCEATRRSLLHQSRAAPGSPKVGSRMVRGVGVAAGGVVQFLDKLSTGPWLCWGRSWGPCSSWTRLPTCPLLSLWWSSRSSPRRVLQRFCRADLRQGRVHGAENCGGPAVAVRRLAGDATN